MVPKGAVPWYNRNMFKTVLEKVEKIKGFSEELWHFFLKLSKTKIEP